MPEYKRFIAYFYEYINGKKQKNAGFAKVELRSGMWRILFRLMTEVPPEPPVQVYGFVRERGYLLGLPMGTMRPGQEKAEEWAYRVDTPVARNYRLKDLAGIWIRSGEGRCFLTVWDDEPVEIERLVLELPEEKQPEERQPEERQPEERQPNDEPPRPEHPKNRQPEINQPEQEPLEADPMEKEQPEQPREIDVTDDPEEQDAIRAAEQPQITEGAQLPEMAQETGEADMREALEAGSNAVQEIRTAFPKSADRVIKELFQKRQPLEQRGNTEFTCCVMIRPCDIVRLQQEGWKVGRSSFLQHAFHQYRHLLLAMTDSGGYVLGVPGMQNPQEQYMAQLFGFQDFKLPGVCGCGRIFGYWCKPLCRDTEDNE